MAKKVGRKLNEEPPAADTWICPVCHHENVAVLSCAWCGQLRYWRAPVERTESDPDADMAGSEDMQPAETAEGHDRLEKGWICTNCGNRNVGPAYCTKCGQKKSGQVTAVAQESGNTDQRPFSEGMTSTADKPERPGCVTAYAILLWIGAGPGLLASFYATGSSLGGYEIIVIGVVIVLLAINVVTGIGLWQMKKWGWTLVVVVQGLNLAAQLFSMGVTLLSVVGSGGDLPALDPAVLCGNVAALAVGSIVLYWFIDNRELFNGGTEYKSVVRPGSEIRQEPVKKTNDTW